MGAVFDLVLQGYYSGKFKTIFSSILRMDAIFSWDYHFMKEMMSRHDYKEDTITILIWICETKPGKYSTFGVVKLGPQSSAQIHAVSGRDQSHGRVSIEAEDLGGQFGRLLGRDLALSPSGDVHRRHVVETDVVVLQHGHGVSVKVSVVVALVVAGDEDDSFAGTGPVGHPVNGVLQGREHVRATCAALLQLLVTPA